MADNITVTQGAGTSIATDEVSDVQHQLIKVEFGTDGVATMVSASDPLPVDGSGVTQPVSGTVTAELSATDNAVLDAVATDTGTIAGDTTSIDGKIPALGQALAAASVPVVLPADQITALTPPAAISGFATSAKQDTIIGHVDGIETLLGTIDGDTGTIATEVAGLLTDTELRATPVPVSGTVTTGGLTDTELRATPVPVSGTVAVTNAGITTIAGAVAGTEMQVDVLTMPTTTVTATDLDIRNLTNTDVVTAELSATDNAVLDDIAADTEAIKTSLAGTLTVTGGGGGTEYTEGATDSTITGSAIMWEDTGDTLTPVSAAKPLPVSASIDTTGLALAANQQTDALTDTELRATPVPVSGTVAVTNSDIATIAGAVKAEDAAHSSGDVGIQALTVRKDSSSAVAGADGDYSPLTTDQNGKLWVRGAMAQDGAWTVGLGSGTQNIGDVDVLSVVPGVGATNLGKQEDTAHTTGDVGVMALGVRSDSWTTLASNGDYIPTAHTAYGGVTVAGRTEAGDPMELTIDGTSYALYAGGDKAHDDADWGKPLKVGGYAKATAPTAVSADGDRVNAWFDLNGRLQIGDGGQSLKVNANETSTMYNGTTALTPKFINVNTGAVSGAEIIALVSAKKIRVLSAFVNVNNGSSAEAVTLRSNGAAGTIILGPVVLDINGGFVLPYNPVGWCETAAGENLYANLGNSSGASITITYIEV